MSEISAKDAIAALLQRAGLEVAAAAKVLDANAKGKAIVWEELFSTGGSLGLSDSSCHVGNTGCRANEGCTSSGG